MTALEQMTLWDPPLRVELVAQGHVRAGDVVGALGFQRWLEHWKRVRSHRVLVARDGSHAVAVPK